MNEHLTDQPERPNGFGHRIVILATLMLTSFGCVTGQAAAQAPSVIPVPGLIRDFRADHPDFNVTPAGGFGHYAGNVSYTIGANQNPVFSGGGFRVNSQWTNKNFDPIAPHMYHPANAVFVSQASTPPVLGDFDTWDSSVGPYGGANIGPAPTFIYNGYMPNPTAPPDLPPSSGDVVYNNDTTLSTDLHCNTLRIRTNKTLTINGNLTIYCDTGLFLDTQSNIELTPHSTLDLYVNTISSSWNHVYVNANTQDPTRVRIYHLGNDEFMIHNHAEVYAQIFAPNAQLTLENHGTLLGNFAGRNVVFNNWGNFHVDTATPRDACSNTIEDNIGAAGSGSSGGITSAATFDLWYTDVLGTNLSQIHTINMVRNGAGVYESTISEFHPIDDRLYGNEGAAHNYFFTYELTADFVYDACTQQFFEFAGSDDAWMFIDGALVLDLGGIIPGINQVVEMDRLNLTDGNSYQFKFFYAQRQAISDFSLRTNAVLQPPVLTATGTVGFD